MFSTAGSKKCIWYNIRKNSSCRKKLLELHFSTTPAKQPAAHRHQKWLHGAVSKQLIKSYTFFIGRSKSERIIRAREITSPCACLARPKKCAHGEKRQRSHPIIKTCRGFFAIREIKMWYVCAYFIVLAFLALHYLLIFISPRRWPLTDCCRYPRDLLRAAWAKHAPASSSGSVPKPRLSPIPSAHMTRPTFFAQTLYAPVDEKWERDR